MQSDRALLYRIGILDQRKPLPPRSVRFAGDLLVWDEPSETGNITHYNVRVGNDAGQVSYRIPVGSTSLRPGLKDVNFFISSWNQRMRTESEKVYIEGQPPDVADLDEALSVITSELGNVTIAPNLITKTRNADGTITVTIPYAPPYTSPVFRTIGNFGGVHRAYEKAGVVEVYPDEPYTANPELDPPGNLGTATITRRWTAPETFYAHLMSWATDGRRLTFSPQSVAPAQRVVAVEITQQDLQGFPSAGNASSLSAQLLSTRVDEAGKQWAKIRVTYANAPGMEVYRAYAYLGTSPPTSVEDWGAMRVEGTGTRLDFEVEAPADGGTYQIAVTASPRGFVVPITTNTPVTTIVLAARGKAPNVVGFDVQVVNLTRQGVPVTEWFITFSAPVSVNWGGVKIQRRAANGAGVPVVGSEWEDLTGIIQKPTAFYPGARSVSAVYYLFRALSATPAGEFNEDNPPTVFKTITGGSGVDLSQADALTYDSDFAIINGALTLSGVNFALAYGFDTTAFQVSGGAFTVKEIAANKIVTGQLGAGVVYAGAVNVDKLIGTSASFAADVTFARASGGSMALNSTGVRLVGGASTVDVTGSGLSIASMFGTSVLSGGGVNAPNVTATSTTSINHYCGNFETGNGTVTLGNAGTWHTALGLGAAATKGVGAGADQVAAGDHTHTLASLGLTTATLNYKDHNGDNQSMTVVVPV